MMKSHGNFATSGRIHNKIIAVLCICSVLAFLCALGGNTKVAEEFTRTVSRALIAVLGTLFGWLPFSVYELFLIVAIVFAVTAVVLVVVWSCKRQSLRAVSMLLTLAIVVTSFLTLYKATASFAYERAPLPTAVYSRQDPDTFGKEQAIDLARKVVKAVNQAYADTPHDDYGNIILPNVATIRADIAEEYKRLDDPLFDGYFSSYTPTVKTIVNKTIMSEMHIVGVFFGPSGEANINPIETNYNLPHTMAHEMAHGKGIMRENEANLVASYLLLTSSKPYLRYSALMKTFYSAISLVSMYPDTKTTVTELRLSINDGIYTEFANYSELWSRYTLIGDIGNWLNDIYLKFHKQTGSDSYYKPSESEGTGEKDNEGEEIKVIINFSDTQSLLVKLYNEGRI